MRDSINTEMQVGNQSSVDRIEKQGHDQGPAEPQAVVMLKSPAMPSQPDKDDRIAESERAAELESSSNTSHTPHQAKLNKPVSQLNPIKEKSPPETLKSNPSNYASKSRDKTPQLDAILGYRAASNFKTLETASHHRPSVPRILTNPTFESLLQQ